MTEEVERKYTNQQLADCARRESWLRKRVYPKHVAADRMTAHEAAEETAKMLEIERVFRAWAKRDAPDLFGE
jgi:hypothetical protein